MATEPRVETITESLGRLLLFLQHRRAIAPSRRAGRPRAAPSTFHPPPPPADRVSTLGNGQMLLHDIAEPRLWPFNRTTGLAAR